MPSLTIEDVLNVRSRLMSRYSALKLEIPITKNQLTALLTIMDAEQNSAEIAVALAVPAGPPREWIIANDKISRDMIVEVESERRDTL